MKLCMLNKWESQREKNMVFAIVADNDDRLVIAPVNSKLAIVPTELVSADDVRIVGDTCN